MSILDHFTDTTHPQNRFLCLANNTVYEIIAGGSAMHTFVIPFIYSSIIDRGNLIYRQGFDNSLHIPITLDMIKEDSELNRTFITVRLSPEQTNLFTNTVLDTFCQFELQTLEGEVIYSDKYKVIVQEPLTKRLF